MIGRASKWLELLLLEDKRFWGIFGVSAYVAQMALTMMKEHGLLPDRNHAGLWVDLRNFTLVTCKYRPYKLLLVTRLQLREFLAILHTLSHNSGSEFIGPVYTSETKFCKSTLLASSVPIMVESRQKEVSKAFKYLII